MYFPLRLYLFLELYVTVGQITTLSFFLPKGEKTAPFRSRLLWAHALGVVLEPVWWEQGGWGRGVRGRKNLPRFMERERSRPQPHPRPPSSSNLPMSSLSLGLDLQGSVREGHESRLRFLKTGLLLPCPLAPTLSTHDLCGKAVFEAEESASLRCKGTRHKDSSGHGVGRVSFR